MDVLLQSAVARLYNQTTFKMSDTLGSWFIITGLHVWFVLLRLRQEADQNDDGFADFRDAFVDILWIDVKQRLDKFSRRGHYLTESTKRKETELYYSYLTTSMIDLDEGIMSDDKVLAGALWRLFYKNQQVDDVVVLNRLVRYVRMQVHRLSQHSIEDIINTGLPDWEIPSDL